VRSGPRLLIATEPLGSNLNLSTLSLPIITLPNGTNDVQVTVPPSSFNPAAGVDEFTSSVDLRPNQSLLVAIDALLNPTAQTLTWTLTSIDPTTGKPPTNPLVGFLPPGAGASVSFSAAPLTGLATGSQVQEQATIVFDGQAPMSTQTWLNTIDNTPPKSQVTALPTTESAANFNVQWSGTDQGSGIQYYTIYVSDNGGPFVAFQSNTAATSASFSGRANDSYGFYSIAQDLAGNIEGAKTAAEATTQVAPFSLSAAPTTLIVAAPGGSSNATVTIPPAPGFSGTVDLSCSVSYNGQGTANDPPTCKLGATQLNITAPDSGSTTLTVSTTAPQQATASPVGRGSRTRPLGSVILVLLLPLTTARRRRAQVRALVVMMIVLASLALLPSCGGGSSGGGGGGMVGGTTVGNYTIAITAASGGYSTNVSVPLAVQ
jgi:hypothetical protein